MCYFFIILLYKEQILVNVLVFDVCELFSFFAIFNMIEVQFWAKMWCLEVFKFQSSCYVTRLVLEHTVWCSRTVPFFDMFGSVRSSVLLLWDQTSHGTYSLMFANCSVFCDVRHVRSSILGQNVMFGMFDVRTFNVRSVRSSVFWCSFQD